MDEIALLFGRPTIREKGKFLEALREIQSSSECHIQALDAGKVACERHLTFAARKALKAFSEGRNVAKDLGVEILRYASGQRQIERALSMGLADDTERIALVAICGSPEGSRSLDLCLSRLSRIVEADGLGCSFREDAIRAAFEITDQELSAAGGERIPDLVLERVALTDTYR
jgi:KEOPS complex subunit Cgi121